MLNIKSLNKKVDQLRADIKVKGDIISYDQVETEEGNLLQYISSFIGDSFISRLEPIISPITSNEATRNVLGILTTKELNSILELEGEE